MPDLPDKPRRPVAARSGYRGVTKRHGRWVAVISINGRSVHLGTFDSAIEAARAFDAKARELRGAEANLNFPDSK